MISAAGAAASRTAAAPRPYLEFTHLTDTHVMRLDGVDERLVKRRQHYEHTRQALPALLRQFKTTHRSEFVLHTGDAIDAFAFEGVDGEMKYGQVEAFAEIVRGSPLPVYAALGNHDIAQYAATGGADQSCQGQAEASWIRSLPCFARGAHYAFHRAVGATQWRFVVLNNGYYGAFPGRKTPPDDGGLDQAQLDWLAAQARRYPDDPLVLAAHIPLRETGLRDIAAAVGHRGNLAALFTGHIHKSNQIIDLPFEGAPAFNVATWAYGQGATHWRRIRLLEKGMEVFKTGDPETLDRRL